MPHEPTPDQHHINIAPWEKLFSRVLTPLENFIRLQTTSSLLLLLCTITALIAANTSISESYLHALHTPIAVSVGEMRFELSAQHWINEALMSFFFLIVGLELKRELLVGELADLRRAAMPVLAAIGGMVVPALLYWYWNPTGIAATGWGIPMATDIAFAIGALSMLKNRVPPALLTFLIALAIVDDIGAVLVIALFYTEKLHTEALMLCTLLTAVLITLNLGGIRRVLPYLLVGVLLWCAMLNSGIHATLAGIVLAFTIPVRPQYNAAYFISEVKRLSQQMMHSWQDNPDIHHNDALRVQLMTLEEGTERAQAPAQRLEHLLHAWVTYGVIPLFALTNAAIPIDFSALTDIAQHPVTLGVTSGLVLGKWLGIVGTSWLALKMGIAAMPKGLTMHHLHGIGLLAGIGFTMSIFVADLAFSSAPELLLMAKTGILLASILSGVCGYCWLRFSSNSYKISP